MQTQYNPYLNKQRKKKNSVVSYLIALIIFNAIIDSFDFFIGRFTAPIRGTVYFFVFFLFLYQNDFKIRLNSAVKFILIFLMYTLILTMQSSNFAKSITWYVAIASTFAIYIISYNAFRNFKDLKRLKIIVIVIPIIFIINNIVFNSLGIGQASYEGAEFLSGGLTHNKVYPVSLIIVLWLFIYPHFKNFFNKLFSILLVSISVIMLFLILRRTGLLVLAIGFLAYGVFEKRKFNLIVTSSLIVIIIIATIPLYKDYLTSAIEARGYRVTFEKLRDRGLTSEIRFREIFSVNRNIFSFDDYKYSFFGKEIYNSAGTYNSDKYYFAPTRILHSDYSIILHGSGIIGLILYTLIFIKIYKEFSNSLKYTKHNQEVKTLKNIFIVFFILLLAISIPGRLIAISFRSILFLMLGAVTGILYNSKVSKCEKVKY